MGNTVVKDTGVGSVDILYMDIINLFEEYSELWSVKSKLTGAHSSIVSNIVKTR